MYVMLLIYLLAFFFGQNFVFSSFDLYKSIFGKFEADIHFQNENEFHISSHHRDISLSFISDYNHFVVACGKVSDGHQLLNSFETDFGKHNLQLIFTSSVKIGLACFKLMTSSSQEDKISLYVASPHIHWIHVPLPLKISSTLLHLLSQVLGNHSSSSFDYVSSSALEVEVGIGFHDKEELVHHSIRNFSHLIDTFSVDRMKQHAKSMEHRNSALFAQFYGILLTLSPTELNLSVSQLCTFDDLHITNRRRTFIIENMLFFHDSKLRSVCLYLLAMTLIEIATVTRVHLFHHPFLLNDLGTRAVQSTSSFRSSSKVYNDVGLTGDGIIIGVADTGLDRNSCYFSSSGYENVASSTYLSPLVDLLQRKVVSYVAYGDAEDDTGHGTHVCGTLAGSIEGVSSAYEGLATGSKLAFYDVGKTGDSYLKFPDLSTYVFTAAKAAGSTLHSNSWGSRMTTCNSWCAEVDGFMAENPDFLILFAAGNSGPDAGTISVPAMAKNPVCVGATNTGHNSGSSLNTLPSWSSRGPTLDGRFGVDILAPGSYLKSARAGSTCGAVAMYGTSMATPLAAGAAALIQQYFKDPKFWASHCRTMYAYCKPFSPSAAMTKAALLHSGVDIGGGYAWPGPEQGFGRIDLSTVLYYPGASEEFELFVSELTLRSYESVSMNVVVTSASRPLKATISWVDPANDAGSQKQLLHDIDLSVHGPDGNVWLGNGKDKADNVNTAEMVCLRVATNTRLQ